MLKCDFLGGSGAAVMRGTKKFEQGLGSALRDRWGNWLRLAIEY